VVLNSYRTLRAVTTFKAALKRARKGTFPITIARTRRTGSKARAKTISEIRYRPVVMYHDKPFALAYKTPAGIPPPTGIRKSFKT
jgi:hypothetical protein